MSLKNSNNIIGKEIRDLPVVAECLNQLRHSVPPESKVLNKIFAPNREEQKVIKRDYRYMRNSAIPTLYLVLYGMRKGDYSKLGI